MEATRVFAASAPPSTRPGAVRCLVCAEVLEVSASLPGLLRCAQCGFITADAALDEQALAALYGKDYFHGSEYLDYVQERESLRLNFRRRLRTLDALLGGLGGKSVLEIGCAYGFFLELAREYGMMARGIDISDDGVRYAREKLGVDAVAGDYLAFRTPPVDLVVMWDTVEHLPRPDLFVEKAAVDLRTGGLIAITTGDIGSFNARCRGRRWRMIHPPTHLHYFSVPTLQRLLARNGFEIMHVSHPGVSRKLHSILYIVLAHRLGAPEAYRMLRRLTPDVAVTLNLQDIMLVVARKRGPASVVAREPVGA